MARGVAASPITRTCSLNGPTNPVAITVTTGSLMYLDSRCSSSRASWDGVFDQRQRQAAIGAYRYGHAQLGVAPHEDVELVARSNDVFARRQGRSRRRRRQGGPGMAPGHEQPGGQAYSAVQSAVHPALLLLSHNGDYEKYRTTVHRERPRFPIPARSGITAKPL